MRHASQRTHYLQPGADASSFGGSGVVQPHSMHGEPRVRAFETRGHQAGQSSTHRSGGVATDPSPSPCVAPHLPSPHAHYVWKLFHCPTAAGSIVDGDEKLAELASSRRDRLHDAHLGHSKGLRAAKTPAPRGNMVYFRKVLKSFEAGEVPSLVSVGEVIANRIRAVTTKPVVMNMGLGSAARAGTEWSSGGSQATGPQGPTKKPRFDYGNRISGSAFAKAWAGDVHAVETKVGKNFNGVDFCREQGKMAAFFGSEFNALMPPDNPNPCMSFFPFGSLS